MPSISHDTSYRQLTVAFDTAIYVSLTTAATNRTRRHSQLRGLNRRANLIRHYGILIGAVRRESFAELTPQRPADCLAGR